MGLPSAHPAEAATRPPSCVTSTREVRSERTLPRHHGPTSRLVVAHQPLGDGRPQRGGRRASSGMAGMKARSI